MLTVAVRGQIAAGAKPLAIPTDDLVHILGTRTGPSVLGPVRTARVTDEAFAHMWMDMCLEHLPACWPIHGSGVMYRAALI